MCHPLRSTSCYVPSMRPASCYVPSTVLSIVLCAIHAPSIVLCAIHCAKHRAMCHPLRSASCRATSWREAVLSGISAGIISRTGLVGAAGRSSLKQNTRAHTPSHILFSMNISSHSQPRYNNLEPLVCSALPKILCMYLSGTPLPHPLPPRLSKSSKKSPNPRPHFPELCQYKLHAGLYYNMKASTRNIRCQLILCSRALGTFCSKYITSGESRNVPVQM
jgi:hypothetical protein